MSHNQDDKASDSVAWARLCTIGVHCMIFSVILGTGIPDCSSRFDEVDFAHDFICAYTSVKGAVDLGFEYF